jgi:hypothetical protein
MELHVIIYYCMLALTASAAHWRGDSCQRLGAWIAIVASICTTAVPRGGVWSDLATPIFFIDVFTLAGFWALALFSRSFWPYWATGWQLVGSLVHVQRALFDDILEKPYGLLSMYIAYPILGVILVASLTHNRKSSGRAAVSGKLPSLL